MPADSNETLRQIMSGFSTMQYNMGLLPMQQNQALAGSPMMQAPPPPQVPHPAEAAMIAMQRHNDMVQQTLMAAQVTRYQPPPSAPMPSVSSMASPFMGGGFSPFMGGGGGSPFAMGSGGMAASSYVPRMPSVFNPFAPTLPQTHFASPAMRNVQMMQHGQSQMMGMMAGGGEAALGVGGSLLGGALGTAIGGPIGGFVGSWLGNKVGSAVSSMIFNPVTQDFQRGRQIQAMTSPYMVSGPFMNTATGQGMDPHAARQVASGIRHMGRDLDFERTGFNSQDAIKMMQMSADHGLLTGANSPDQLVQKVKDISKTVKVLMRITGDPDVRDAIASLGQMRDMGFMGMASQAGAVANRAMFARQAGMSQSQMTATMMAGAEMAGTMGLAGATGANAAMAGAGAANVAASSGAVNDLQLSRAGGTRGLGQIASAGALSAMQNEMYLLAGSKIGAGGKIQLDMDAFRHAQGMGFNEVNKLAASNLQQMQNRGIFDWNTRKQELKDEIAQRLKPGEMQTMMLQQANAFMKSVPGMTLGTAIQQTTGLSAEQSRSLEAMYSSRKYYDAMIEQRHVQAREMADEARAERESYYTPGIGTRMRRGVSGFFGGVSDALSSPFHRISEHLDRVHETDTAQSRGELISRYDQTQLVRTAGDRRLLEKTLNSGYYNALSAQTYGGLGSESGGSRMMNRIGSAMGLSAESNDNRLVEIESGSQAKVFGWNAFSSFGSVDAAKKGAADRARTAAAINTKVSGKTYDSLYTALERAGVKGSSAAMLSGLTQDVVNQAKYSQAGTILSASALNGEYIKRNTITRLRGEGGLSALDAEKFWDEHGHDVIAQAADQVKASGDRSLYEPFAKTAEQAQLAGGVDFTRSRKAVRDAMNDNLSQLGLRNIVEAGGIKVGHTVSDDTLAQLKGIFVDQDKDVSALAIIQASGDTAGGRAKLAEMQKRLGSKFGGLMQKATDLRRGLSASANEALGTMGAGARTAGRIDMNVGLATNYYGMGEAAATDEQFFKALTGISDKATGDTIEEALGNLSDADIDSAKISSRKKEILKKAKRGDAKDVAAARMAFAPTNVTTRSSAETLAADDDDLVEARETFAKDIEDGKDTSADATKVQADSTKLFADSVQLFAKSIRTASGQGEQDHLDDNIPTDVGGVGG